MTIATGWAWACLEHVPEQALGALHGEMHAQAGGRFRLCFAILKKMKRGRLQHGMALDCFGAFDKVPKNCHFL